MTARFDAAVSIAIHELPDVNGAKDFMCLPGSVTARYYRYASSREAYALTVELGERAAYCLKVWESNVRDQLLEHRFRLARR